MPEQLNEQASINDRIHNAARALVSLGYHAVEKPLLGAMPGLLLADYVTDPSVNDLAETGAYIACGYSSYKVISWAYKRYGLRRVALDYRQDRELNKELNNLASNQREDLQS